MFSHKMTGCLFKVRLFFCILSLFFYESIQAIESKITSAGGLQFTGSATASIPIVAPPGRSAAATPQIVLTYSSSKGNSFAGMSWDLNLGAIERKVMQGFFDPENKPDHLLLVTQSCSQELYFAGVRGSNEGEWRLKIREGLPPKIHSKE